MVGLMVGLCPPGRPRPAFSRKAVRKTSDSTPLVCAAAAPLDPPVVVQEAVGILDARALENTTRS
jgi:hypothetical protein